jgi:hypothetical protein
MDVLCRRVGSSPISIFVILQDSIFSHPVRKHKLKQSNFRNKLRHTSEIKAQNLQNDSSASFATVRTSVLLDAHRLLMHSSQISSL